MVRLGQVCARPQKPAPQNRPSEERRAPEQLMTPKTTPQLSIPAASPFELRRPLPGVVEERNEFPPQIFLCQTKENSLLHSLTTNRRRTTGNDLGRVLTSTESHVDNPAATVPIWSTPNRPHFPLVTTFIAAPWYEPLKHLDGAAAENLSGSSTNPRRSIKGAASAVARTGRGRGGGVREVGAEEKGDVVGRWLCVGQQIYERCSRQTW